MNMFRQHLYEIGFYTNKHFIFENTTEHKISTKPAPANIIHNAAKGDKQAFDTVSKLVYSRSFNLSDTDTSKQLKPMDITPLLKTPTIAESLAKKFGYEFKYFTSDPNKVRTLTDGTKIQIRPDNLKQAGYDKGIVWVYDPWDEHGSFNEVVYTKIWREIHELAHGITEKFMQEKYGTSKRFGAMSFNTKNPYNIEDKRTYRGLTLKEAQRALEWEDVAFRAQIELYKMLGLKIPVEQAVLDFNIAAHDVVIRLLTGDFSNPGTYGIIPKSNTRASVKYVLKFLENQYKENSKYLGLKAEDGIDLVNWKPISDKQIGSEIQKQLL